MGVTEQHNCSFLVMLDVHVDLFLLCILCVTSVITGQDKPGGISQYSGYLGT